MRTEAITLQQRTLKFRALYAREGELFWSHTSIDLDGTVTLEAVNDTDKQLSPWLLFTGLLDETGREVFEGDIVTPAGESWFNSIQFRVGCFCIGKMDAAQLGQAYTFPGDNEDHHRLKVTVVGNIYEHPELLTK